MKIWLLNNYNMLPSHGHLNRNYYLGKYLKRQGHEPIAFVGSHPHNSDMQLIKGAKKYFVFQEEPFPWVLIKTRNYEGSKFKRVISMFEFYFNMKSASNHFEIPDVIIGSSAHPLAALLAIRLGNKYGCKKIVEIRDFWPQSIVDFGVAKKSNPIIKILYKFEKYLYLHADKIILTMENGYQYFIDKGLSKVIPEEKVFYLNNGVDVEEYKNNVKTYVFEDEELQNVNLFNVVYAGSIRKANNLGLILDVAKIVKNRNIRFLIWGDGDERETLKKRCVAEKIDNVIFKGRVEKKYIPYITSKANLNIMHLPPSPVLKYGLSANKLFDYAAAGRPIFTDFECGMNPAIVYGAGINAGSSDSVEIAKKIDDFSFMDKVTYKQFCDNALRLASNYSFENLARKLIEIINSKELEARK